MMSYYTPSILEALAGVKFKSILEVGCGNGCHLVEIKKQRPQVRAEGFDVAENEHENATTLAKEAGVDITFRVLDLLGCLPYRAKSFDVVLTAAVLILIPQESIVEVAAKLKRIARKTIVIMDRHDESKDKFGVREDSGTGPNTRMVRNYKELFAPYQTVEAFPVPRWRGEILVITL